MTEQIGVAIRNAAALFEQVSDSARLDAELLLAECLQKPRSYLYSWPEETLAETVWLRFRELIRQRMKPTPVAYLLGYREFYSLEFKTTAAALIPRPETELLVAKTLLLCEELEHTRILEMGTGSGAISVALLKQRSDINIITTDISIACLQLASENASLHGVKLHSVESNWYQNLVEGKVFDLIVSNPPYIAADDSYLMEGDLPAEPALALTPGQTGLEAIEQIIYGAAAYLKSKGYLVLEHGHDQADEVCSMLELAGFQKIQNERDFSGLPRLSYARLP
jgi:release factor glutamine methyltransferase